MVPKRSGLRENIPKQAVVVVGGGGACVLTAASDSAALFASAVVLSTASSSVLSSDWNCARALSPSSNPAFDLAVMSLAAPSAAVSGFGGSPSSAAGVLTAAGAGAGALAAADSVTACSSSGFAPQQPNIPPPVCFLWPCGEVVVGAADTCSGGDEADENPPAGMKATRARSSACARFTVGTGGGSCCGTHASRASGCVSERLSVGAGGTGGTSCAGTAAASSVLLPEYIDACWDFSTGASASGAGPVAGAVGLSHSDSPVRLLI